MHKPTRPLAPSSAPLSDLVPADPDTTERMKAEFRKRMKESAKKWPGKRKSPRR